MLEIILTIVITAITITALVSALATAGSAGQSQRNSVSTDAVMRNYAEATKAVARECISGADLTVPFVAPGFTVAAEPAGATCPDPTETLRLDLTVTGPTGISQTMTIRIRTP